VNYLFRKLLRLRVVRSENGLVRGVTDGKEVEIENSLVRKVLPMLYLHR
jgi:hypothetical protein